MNLALSILLATIASCAAFAPPSSTAIRPTVSSPFQEKKPSYFYENQNTSMLMSEGTSGEKKSDLPMLLDPGTKGGALFLSLILFIVPIIGYEIATIGFGVDGIEAGKWIGVGFTFFTTVLWVGTYIFRVATKDMTYVSFFFVCRFILIFNTFLLILHAISMKLLDFN